MLCNYVNNYKSLLVLSQVCPNGSQIFEYGSYFPLPYFPEHEVKFHSRSSQDLFVCSLFCFVFISIICLSVLLVIFIFSWHIPDALCRTGKPPIWLPPGSFIGLSMHVTSAKLTFPYPNLGTSAPCVVSCGHCRHSNPGLDGLLFVFALLSLYALWNQEFISYQSFSPYSWNDVWHISSALK